MQITASSQLGGIAGNLYRQLRVGATTSALGSARYRFSSIGLLNRSLMIVIRKPLFAGACLRFTRHVMSGQSVDKALRLNRGTKLKTELIDCLSERFLQLKVVERQLLLAGCVCHG